MNTEMSEFEKAIDSAIAAKLEGEFNEASYPLRKILDGSTQVGFGSVLTSALNLLDEIKKAHIKHHLPSRRKQLMREVLNSIKPPTTDLAPVYMLIRNNVSAARGDEVFNGKTWEAFNVNGILPESTPCRRKHIGQPPSYKWYRILNPGEITAFGDLVWLPDERRWVIASDKRSVGDESDIVIREVNPA